MEMESPSTVDRGLDEESTSPFHREVDSNVINSLSLEEGQVSQMMFDAGSSSSSLSSVPSIVHNNLTEFLPIKTEIKKMGVEISDERAEQLKNDVRRLSPEVVSLRERTLGEISLTPDSSFFEANENQENDGNEEENSETFTFIHVECEPTNLEFCVESSSASNFVKCNEGVPSSVKNGPCSDLDRDECVSADVLVPFDNRTVKKTENSVAKFDGALDTLQNSANCPTSPSRGVIQKLQENEEIVFTGVDVPHVQLQASSSSSSLSSSSSTFSSSSSSSSPTTNTINFMIAYPEAGRCSSTESADQDPLRDHGETEGTDSDCSEQNSLQTNVLNAVIITDGVHLDLQDQGIATEREIILSRDRIDRIEPEQFTEDSAESLALATGNRDEVRSDGSDSGLGGEITGDHNGIQAGNAPESDSETSFLDRIPDDILSDKDKTASGQLDGFVQVQGITETLESCQVQRPVLLTTPILPALRSPPKSNLKRRLTDCMEGEPNPKRINPDESQKKKRNIQFDAVTVYYFPRAQGFTCVPSQGGSTLGMSAAHTHAERFSLTEHAAEQRRIHRARLAQLRSERAANNVVEAASSSEDPSDDTDEEPSDAEELDIDSYYFLLPVPTWQRRALLRAAGVQKIDTVEKDECRDIRASRKHCGCGCKGYCDPESCPCSRAHVKCQVDRAGFPCGCSRDGCANSSGRIEFNPVRVRTHFIHTLMRLEIEKKHRDEDCPDLRDLDSQQPLQGPLRDVRGLPIPSADPSCSINGSGFTTLHYPTTPDIGSCHSELPRPREDSLDLYAIRDDCYPASEDVVDTVGQIQTHHTHHQRKLLHPAEFGQTFQSFSTPVNNSSSSCSGVQQQFQQNNYQDYQAYQTLPSTSRGQFHPQFQQNHTNQGFNHYVGYVGDNTIAGCHQQQNLYDGGNFSQDDGSPSQYTNLNSVQQPAMISAANSIVHNSSHPQIIGKLEPFSELLAGRYSYYGEIEQQTQNHSSVYPTNSTEIKSTDGSNDDDKIIVNEINSTIMSTTRTTMATATTLHEETQESNMLGQHNTENEAATEECDENFGEIIKKSMVETVSA